MVNPTYKEGAKARKATGNAALHGVRNIRNERRQIKKLYKSGEIMLGDAVTALMFDYDMERGEAISFLEKV